MGSLRGGCCSPRNPHDCGPIEGARPVGCGQHLLARCLRVGLFEIAAQIRW